jgi:hypothetical protein
MCFKNVAFGGELLQQAVPVAAAVSEEIFPVKINAKDEERHKSDLPENALATGSSWLGSAGLVTKSIMLFLKPAGNVFLHCKREAIPQSRFLRRLPAPLFLKETVNRRLSPALVAETAVL